MAIILNIDSSTETASVVVAENGREIAREENRQQRDHASWLHDAISYTIRNAGIGLADLKAIAVTSGPGSYTGIRVGMASAKGLAYALSVPLITENTLKVMAYSQSAIDLNQNNTENNPFFCPMIDARRDEVFTAVYDGNLVEILPPSAVKLDPEFFAGMLSSRSVIFFGSGSDKWKQLSGHVNSYFQKWDYAYFNLAYLSFQSWQKGAFADLAYVSPDYLKEFYTHKKN